MQLLDNSAWSRLLTGAVPAKRTDGVIASMDEGQIATCLPLLLEAGYSAHSAEDHRRISARLGRLPAVPLDAEVERLALQAQYDLAEVGHHRLPPLDLIIAACAHRAEAGVLHYDRDYDLIAEHTGLRFESVWLAPAGSL